MAGRATPATHLDPQPLIEALKRAAAERRMAVTTFANREWDLLRRAVHHGGVLVFTADRICVHVLGVHPTDVYGERWLNDGEDEDADGVGQERLAS